MWRTLRLLRRVPRERLWPSVVALYLCAHTDENNPILSTWTAHLPPISWPLDPPTRTLCQGTETKCSSSSSSSSSSSTLSSTFLRKRATLKQASGGLEPPSTTGSRRHNTAQALNKLRTHRTEMLKRWERDEDGWRELPARAWPAFQPNVEQMEKIRTEASSMGCHVGREPSYWGGKECQEMLFQIATTMVFYNHDPKFGLEIFQKLAENGHVDAMVACGVVLVEGLGVPPVESKGLAWLQKAVNLGSSQACYELATVYYTGITDVLEEDAEKAFALFELAAQAEHVAAMYMMADCLAEGEGVTKDVARAVPLFYKAAEKGHRFARQRIRELLASPEYKKIK